jgi:hypothetical protein
MKETEESFAIVGITLKGTSTPVTFERILFQNN